MLDWLTGPWPWFVSGPLLGLMVPILLFFGNIRPYKGLDTLLEATAKIDDSHIKLIIAGQPWDGFEPYQSLIDKYRLHNRITKFLEFIPDEKLAQLLQAADLVVLPYKQLESASGPATAALAFEKPLVVTNTASLAELVIYKNTIVVNCSMGKQGEGALVEIGKDITVKMLG